LYLCICSVFNFQIQNNLKAPKKYLKAIHLRALKEGKADDLISNCE